MKKIILKDFDFDFTHENIELNFWQSEILSAQNLLELTNYHAKYLVKLGITSEIIREMYEMNDFTAVYNGHVNADLLTFDFCFVTEGEEIECIECEHESTCFHFGNCQKERKNAEG